MAKKLKDEDLVLNIIINGNKSKKEINDLERAVSSTNGEIKKLKQVQKDLIAQGKKESEAYKATTVAIKEKERAIEMAEARLTQLRKGMKLTEMTSGDLKREMQRLKRLIDNTIPNDPNYQKYKEQLEAVKGRIEELADKADDTGFSLRELANDFNHYIGVITAGIVTLISLITGLQNIVSTFAEFDDQVADVQKTTGLLKEDVLELNEELKKIDTRTSQENLLGLSRVAGKLGISAKDDVLGFVRAADKIGVALAEDLGGDVEEAINQVGKLVDIFNLKEDFGIEKGLMKVGSTINTLGASSTANEGYLVNFTNRMAGVAPLAGITIDQILGLGATLDQFGQTAEVSSTALSKLFMNMSSDAKTYAKYAGLSVDEFKKNLEVDFMGTFVKVLKGVKSTSGGINELVETLGDLGEDGGRVVGVLGVLANNTEILQNQLHLANKSFDEGISLTQEFAIKNETAAAQLEKARKVLYNLTVDLGQKLSGAVTISTKGLTYLVKILSVLINFVIENKKVLTVLISGLIAYNAVVLYQTILQKASNAETKLGIALAKLKVFWDRVLVASTHLVGAAYLALTGRMAAAKAEMLLFNNAAKLNPWAALIGAIVAVGVAIATYTQKLTAAQKAQKDLNDVKQEANESISQEREKIKQTLSVLNAETTTRAQKLSAIKNLREIMPGYLQAYKDEEILAGKATTAISLYVKEMERRALIEAGTRKLAELQNKKDELLAKRKAGFNSLSLGDQYSSQFRNFFSGQTNDQDFAKEIKEQLTEVETFYEQLSQRMNKYAASVFDNTTVKGLQSQADYLVAQLPKLKKNTEAYKKVLTEIQELNKQIAFKKANPDAEVKVNIGLSDKELKKQAQEMEKQRKAEIIKENKDYETRLKEAGLFGVQRSLMTSDQLEQLAELEKIHQININAINKKGQKTSLEQASQALAEIRKRQEAERKYRAKLINPQSEEVEQENESHNQRLEKAGLFGKKREQLSKEQLDALAALEGKHQSNLDKIDAQMMQKELERRQSTFETELADLRTKNSEELDDVKNIYQAKKNLEKSLSANQLREIKTLDQAKKAIKKVQLAEENNLTETYAKDLLAKLKSALDSGEFEGINLSDKLLSDEEKKALEKKLKEVSKLLADLKKPGLTEDQQLKRAEQEKLDILGMSGLDWLTLFDNLKKGVVGVETLKTAATALSSIWTSYNQMVGNNERKQVKEFETATAEKKRLLQQQLDSGKISQKRYNEEVEKLDAELDKKKAQADRNAAIRERNVALMSAIVNTASAVTKALPNLFLAALVGAAGAIQVGTILSTPLPEVPGKEEGGFVTREQDGKKFKAKHQPNKRGYVDKPSVLVSENGTEFVANAKAVANPDVKQVLDVIDSAQKNGDVSTLTIEKMMYSSTPTQKIKGRERGGYVSNSSGENNTNSYTLPPDVIDILIKNAQLFEKLSEKLDQPIQASVSILGKDGFARAMEEYNSIVQNSSL